MSQVQVNIEYCGAWGYDSRYEELRKLILREVPNAEVKGNVGRSTSFEVTINEKLVFSKLAKRAFPVYERVVEEVQRASKGEKPEEIVECQKGWCVLL